MDKDPKHKSPKTPYFLLYYAMYDDVKECPKEAI